MWRTRWRHHACFPEYGFVDTLDLYGPAIYTDSAIAGHANQIAAMPSLHFAYAVLVAYLLVRVVSSPLRWLGVVHPLTTVLVIVVTGNHFWLDSVVAGLLVIVLAPLATPARRRLAISTPAAGPGC